PRAHGAATHQAGIAGLYPELRCSLQPPFYDAPRTDPIQFLAKRTDLLRAVVKFAELRRCQRCWLSECLDLKVNEHTDFILDGTGWGCHHGSLNDILADRVRSLHTWLWLFSTRSLDS